jgi:hypothetical protein
MNKSHYEFGIFFLGLALVCSIFHSILYLRLDNQMFAQQSFVNWFLVFNVIWLIGSLIQLRYYRYKKYGLAFNTAVFVVASTVCQLIILYAILRARLLQNMYVPITFLVILTGLANGIVLIFSIAANRPWLKAAGVFISVVCTVLLSAGIGTVLPQAVGLNPLLQQILKWASVAYSLTPIFLMLNFMSELRLLKKTRDTTKLPELQTNMLSLLAFFAVGFALFFGVMILNQSASFLLWRKQNREFAQNVLAQQYEARTFVDGKGDTMRYQFMKPLDYDPQTKYPLVVCLHHGGTHGNDNVSQLGADPAPYLSSNRKKYPAFFLMPQCPQGLGWGNIDSSIFSIIDLLEDEFSIDTTRRYVMGISGGGYGSWHFIAARPEMFAAAIPICGGGDLNLASKIVDIPVWAFHGEEDNLVPVRLSRDMIDAMRKAGGNPKYTEFPDAGHNIWGQVAGTPGLLDWLFAQRRDSP